MKPRSAAAYGWSSLWTTLPADSVFLHGFANTCCTGKIPPNLPPLSINTHTRSYGREPLKWRRFHLLYFLPLLSQIRRDRYRKSGSESPFWNVREPSRNYDLRRNLNRNTLIPPPPGGKAILPEYIHYYG
jgi:hypothetical protein